ncbi:DNA methylase [Sphingomonas sp. EC-HK361]|uniref:DNA methyltransferase n=1 Tax=Sphingomonas sp. EC-HK361 TaxID=2038397 RepID=UPI001258A7A4|nr:DNA methyltransferase [Sphingomonas sp. EC-HK361]VVT07865.1 DNA methylase [Sphingomonas sp. EC-HK361]
MRNRPSNQLFYGDNLAVLRKEIPDASIDLVYLDPPFNSNANYNILFRSPAGTSADAQIEAFEDTWHWNDRAEDAFDQVARSGNTRAFDLLNAMRGFLGENDMMAYLSMMAIRLIELHRVLKPTGSLYLHCDPTASHYLKLLLDGVFGPKLYRNEIIWKRQSAHSDAKHKFADVSDTILFYARSAETRFKPAYCEHDSEYVTKFYRFDDDDGRGLYRLGDAASPNPRPNMMYDWKGYAYPAKGWRYERTTMQRLHDEGRLYYPITSSGEPDFSKRIALKRYLNEQQGSIVTNVWNDISPLNATAREALGYPTQKPLSLLERIIAASSSEGDVVLDPFCGCGTAVHAAQKLGRNWIGIDVTHLAISLIEKRMKAAFPGVAFIVEGTPKDLASAEDLAARDKYQFQWWAGSMIDAMPFGGKKKGADGGIDGIIYFKPDGKRTEKALVSVKGGDHVGVQMIRDLHSVMEREKAPIGIFITKALPTSAMEREAAAVGRMLSDATGKTYARLQILTLADLFVGKRPDIPLVDPGAGFRRPDRESGERQAALL